MARVLPIASTPVEQLYTVFEAAKLLTLSPKTLRAWCGSRRIGVVRLHRAVRIAASEIQRLISEGTVPARQTEAA